MHQGSAVASDSSFPKDLRQPFIELAVESWRLCRLFNRALLKLEAGEATRYSNQLRYFQKRLDDSLASAELKLVNLEGHHFDPGMAATPLNIEDFEPDVPLIVDQMVEPVLMGPDGIVKSGTVMLRTAN